MVNNGHGLGHGALKFPVTQEWIDELSWFFACWCEKGYFNYLVGMCKL